uniref:Uncharacterized protein n=1 Tax=Anguilla anguilla TaxID=7936 RepID=A0A0E9WP61_ANGAN
MPMALATDPQALIVRVWSGTTGYKQDSCKMWSPSGIWCAIQNGRSTSQSSLCSWAPYLDTWCWGSWQTGESLFPIFLGFMNSKI